VNVRMGDRALTSGRAVVGGSGAGGNGDGVVAMGMMAVESEWGVRLDEGEAEEGEQAAE
jgi:hypothetical protein